MCAARVRETSPSSAYRWRLLDLGELLPLGAQCLLGLLAEHPQRVLHFTLLGQDASLLLPGGFLLGTLGGFHLRQPGLDAGERLELLKRDRHRLLGRGGGERGRRRAALILEGHRLSSSIEGYKPAVGLR